MCGFGSGQIARALLKSRSAVEKAISRAKARFKLVAANLEIPVVSDLDNRIDGVLKVIYLQFNEGYKVSEGIQLTNKDLCIDAIRLAELLATYPEFAIPELYALLALMYFQSSRLEGRIDKNGGLLTLDKQDRNSWNYKHILQGNIYLGRSVTGSTISHYHLEATIASFHCASKSYEETNWRAIVGWYDLAIRTRPSKSYRLNRLIAARQYNSAEEILTQVDVKQLPENQFTYIFMGDLFRDTGDKDNALINYERAGKFTINRPEKKFIDSKIEQL